MNINTSDNEINKFRIIRKPQFNNRNGRMNTVASSIFFKKIQNGY